MTVEKNTTPDLAQNAAKKAAENLVLPSATEKPKVTPKQKNFSKDDADTIKSQKEADDLLRKIESENLGSETKENIEKTENLNEGAAKPPKNKSETTPIGVAIPKSHKYPKNATEKSNKGRAHAVESLSTKIKDSKNDANPIAKGAGKVMNRILGNK